MPSVTIYTKPGCPHCAAAMADMQARAMPYTEISVPGNAAALREMLDLNRGQRRVPTIVKDGKVTVGFNGGS